VRFKVWGLTVLLLLFCLPSVFAADRVAVIAYGDQSEAVSVMQETIRSYFKTPLPSLVKIYEFVPGDEIAVSQPKNKEVKRDTLRALAEKTKSDIVVAAQLTDYRTRFFVSLYGDSIRTTSVQVKYHIYLARKDKYMTDRLSRYYHGDDIRFGSPEYLLNEILDDVTEKLRKELPYNPAVILKQNEASD
jgi:hypothetical protein